jgi:hypothetical protein
VWWCSWFVSLRGQWLVKEVSRLAKSRGSHQSAITALTAGLRYSRGR